MKKHILVIYETAGGGHYANARAIEAAFKLKYPECRVTLMHVSVATKSQRIATLYDGYNQMLKFDPRMVRFGYGIMNRVNAEKLILPLIPKASRNLKAYLKEIKPDIVVSVFGVANYAVFDALKDLGWAHQIPFVIFVTDMTRSFLKSWVHPEADMMIAMLPETRDQLVEYGFPAERIAVLDGLPVNPHFITEPRGKEAARRELGIALDRFTVLVTMGGVANKNTIRFSRELADSGLPLQLIVACGRNTALKRKMERLASRVRIPIKVLGFTDQMPLLMDASDVAITKPGPGTIAELVQKEIPMLIDDIFTPMPQEKGNLDFALEKGIALAIDRGHPVTGLIRSLMQDPALYRKMVEATRAIKNPGSVYELIELILKAEPRTLTPA